MKNLFKLTIALLVAVFLNSCSSNSPEKVAEKFLNHLNKKEYADAKKLATKESESWIDMMSSLSTGDTKDQKPAGKIEDLKCKTEADKSTCTYKQDGKDESLNLIKQGDKWLVDMKKENPMNSMTNSLNSLGNSLSGDSTKTEGAK